MSQSGTVTREAKAAGTVPWELWKKGGLQNVQERPLDITMRFASFADYWDPFLLGQGPAGVYVRGLDADRLISCL